MIQELKDTPNTMVGFRFCAEVTKEEFDKILLPAIQELLVRIGKLNYLFVLDKSVTDFGFGAWLEDAMIDTHNDDKWNRAAIVTEYDVNVFIEKVLRRVIPGDFKLFLAADMEKAIHWVSEQDMYSQQMAFQDEDDNRD